jgi:DNA ligase 1
MSLQNVYNIMTQIANESSKTGKETILKRYEGDTDFREALAFLLNPYIVTGISTKKMSKTFEKSEMPKETPIKDLKSLMNYLRKNNTGKDNDIKAIQLFILEQNEDLGIFLTRFATKDLKLGISEKTVNKVYGKGTIPTFAVMLAESYEKKADKIKGKFYITLKLDGNRCIVVNDEDGVKFFSRKGQEISGMSQLAKQFEELPKGWVFDGELLLKNRENLSSADLFRATQKVVRKDGDKKDLEFHVFDALPVSDFKEGKSKENYEQRRNNLDTMFNHFNDGQIQLIHLLPVIYEGDDKSVIPAYANAVEAEGHEGLMINTANGLYQTKRVVDLLKVKSMKTADLLVVSIEKAIDGQFKGLMSRVNVEYKDSLVGIGSGFTLEQRRHFVENPDDIVGKIIEVSYFGESKNEKGNISLRFPIFKTIREDKDIEDINYGE